jgi:hypothetical protein
MWKKVGYSDTFEAIQRRSNIQQLEPDASVMNSSSEYQGFPFSSFQNEHIQQFRIS